MEQLINCHDMDTAELTHVSLCAGYGGIDLGLRRCIPVRTIAYAEIEAFAIENLLARMEEGKLDAAPIWPDLRSFPWEAFRGRVDIISGGFPCQPFSQAGRRAADSDPRHLFPAIKRGISVCRPSVVLLENVEGIISAKLQGDGWADPACTPVLLHVLRELERLGYTAEAGLFSASEVGATHQRKRVFIMAYADDKGSQRSWRELLDGLDGEEKWEDQERYIASGSGPSGAWPSRPLAEQAGWEEPRTIRRGELSFPNARWIAQLMGLDANWVSCGRDNIRDELRLLGNGVVPATAAKAFVTLMRRFLNDDCR